MPARGPQTVGIGIGRGDRRPPEISGKQAQLLTEQVRTPKCKHSLGNKNAYIYIYMHLYI